MTKEELKQIRIDLGMTQKEFAKAIGKNVRTIQRMENGYYVVWKGVGDAVTAYVAKHK